MNLEHVEMEIQDRGLSAPRVSLDNVNDEILREHYFTAAEAIGLGMDPETPEALLTICVLVLRNGFTVTGESACASPANFNAELGRKLARDKAVGKAWAFMGFRLRDRLTVRGMAID